jgi:hypothetical protein
LADYTPYQKGVIRRHYQHSQTTALQKLGEIVSDLYLADSDRRKRQLWARAEQALAKFELARIRKERILAEQDVQALAALVSDLQG